MAKQNAVERTGDANAEPTAADKARAVATAAVQAPLNAVGLNRVLPGIGNKVAGVGLEGAGNALKKYLGTVGTEAATGAARDVVGQVGSTVGTEKGIQYDPNKTAEAALTSGVGSGLLVAPRLAGNVASASKFRDFGGDNAEAATALANRQIEAADGKKLIGPLGGTKTAAEAVAAAHSDVHNELNAAARNENLSTANDNTLKRIQSGGDASPSELTALAQEASPDTVNLARQALLSSKLKDMGEFSDGKFTGGLSGIMEKRLRPIYNPTATLASTAAATLGAGMLPGMIGMAAPHVVGGIYGAYAGARAIDKLTGSRSPAQGFTDKFADPTVPVRTPGAPQAPQAPVTTSVPQIAPPQNTQLWGTPEAPEPNLRATLNANAKVEEGMAKIAKQVQAAKQKSMIEDAMPALQQLAAQNKPQAPTPEPQAPDLSPVALSMLKQKLKTGLPPEASPEAPAAPTAPTVSAPPVEAFDALKPLMGRQRAIMRGLSASSKQQIADNAAQRKAAGVAQAEGLAADSAHINDNGGLSALSNPEFTKRGAQLISAANVMKKLTATPEEASAVSDAPASQPIAELLTRLKGADAPPTAPAAPSAPPEPAQAPAQAPPMSMADVLARAQARTAAPKPAEAPVGPVMAKITKKLNGKVNEVPHPEEMQPYEPIPEDQLIRKPMSDEQVAAHQDSRYRPEAKTPYGEKVVKGRQAKRTALEAVAHDHPESGSAIEGLYHQLDHISRRAVARKAIAHYENFMSPAAAAAVRTHFTRSVMEELWSKE